MRVIFTIIFLVSFWSLASGQVRQTDDRIIEEEMRYSAEKRFNTWAVSVGYGSLFMYGDITNHSFFPEQKISFGPTLIISKQLAPALALDLQYVTGEMYGQSGEHYFEGNLNEVSLTGVFLINQLGANPGPVRDRWNFYLKAGLGVNFFRSRLRFLADDSFVQESDLGMPSGRYLVYGYDPYDPETETSPEMDIVIPFGGGVLYRINKHFDVGLESIMHFSSADKLDNVLSGASNDRYLYSGVNLSYKIGKKDKRHMRWTYRGYGFNLFGRPRKDPLQGEVQRLEEEINKYAEREPIQKDSVIISQSLTTLYDAFSVRSIFFDKNAQVQFQNEDQVLMAEAVIEMKHYPGKYIDLYGYVDAGDSGDLMELSRQQCEKVKDFMVNEMGADAAYIRIFAHGGDSAFTSESGATTPITRKANRRVDIVFRNF
jgi:outer membrane protein OmpA-like peptidoglycan-associated protein